MTKIKNFRIALRPRDVARWVKHQRQLPVTPELEASIEAVLSEAKRWAAPAAVYTTLTRPVAEKATAIALPDKAVAVSVLGVSIGPGLGQQRQAAGARQDAPAEAVWAGFEHEALGQAVQFVVRLIQEQAKEEDCELSSPVVTQEAGLSASLATLLGVQRIGLDLQESPQWPSHARMAWLFWTPFGKVSARRNDPALTGASRPA